MLLIDPAVATAALSGKPCPPVPLDPVTDPIAEPLRQLTERIAAAVETGTLEQRMCVDRFFIGIDNPGALVNLSFSLTNRFVLEGSVEVDGLRPGWREGCVADPGIDYDRGEVTYAGQRVLCPTGVVTVQYISGFELPAAGEGTPAAHSDERYRVAKDVPVWVQRLATDFLVQHIRNMTKAPAVDTAYGFLPTLNDAVLRDIKAMLGSHQRHRLGMHFPRYHENFPCR